MAEVENSYCQIAGCGCVGYGYVPVQMLNEIYCAEDGLDRGTIFPELDLDINEYGRVCKGIGGVL